MPAHMPLAEQLASKYVEGPGCWEWTGALSHTRKGPAYPEFTRRVEPGKYRVFKGHRAMYELHVGPIPEGYVVDHLCENTRCVRPDHLRAVTQRENILRGDGMSARHAAQTHCVRGHAFDEENTYVDKRGSRQCRACRRWRRGI